MHFSIFVSKRKAFKRNLRKNIGQYDFFCASLALGYPFFVCLSLATFVLQGYDFVLGIASVYVVILTQRIMFMLGLYTGFWPYE